MAQLVTKEVLPVVLADQPRAAGLICTASAPVTDGELEPGTRVELRDEHGRYLAATVLQVRTLRTYVLRVES